MSWADGSRRRQVTLNLQWGALNVVRRLVVRLPHDVALLLGGWLGRVVRLFSKRRVDDAEVHCVAVLGVGPTTARRIVKGSYVNMGRGAVEMLRTAWLAPRIEQYVTVSGVEHMERARAAGRGAVLLLGHLANWETANIFFSRRFPISVIGADQRDQRLTDLLMEIRAAAGAINVSKGQGLRGAIRCLQSGGFLAVLMDQDAKEKGLILPFLDEPASTPQGAVKLADRFGSPIIPLQVIRRAGGRFRVIVESPLVGTGGEPGSMDVPAVVQRCNDRLSAWIRAHPDQWLLWTYPRWGRPEPERWRHALSH